MSGKKKVVLALLCIGLAVFGMLVGTMISKDRPLPKSALEVRLVAGPNSTASSPTTLLVLSNRSDRVILYVVYPAQELEKDGWPEHFSQRDFVTFSELPPKGETSTAVELFEPGTSIQRVPIAFQCVQTKWKISISGLQDAIRTKSLRPLKELLLDHSAPFLTNVVFASDRLAFDLFELQSPTDF